MHLSFPTPTFGMKWVCAIQKVSDERVKKQAYSPEIGRLDVDQSSSRRDEIITRSIMTSADRLPWSGVTPQY